MKVEVKNLEIELEKLKDPYNAEGLSEVNTDKINKIEKELDLKLKNIFKSRPMANYISRKTRR